MHAADADASGPTKSADAIMQEALHAMASVLDKLEHAGATTRPPEDIAPKIARVLLLEIGSGADTATLLAALAAIGGPATEAECAQRLAAVREIRCERIAKQIAKLERACADATGLIEADAAARREPAHE